MITNYTSSYLFYIHIDLNQIDRKIQNLLTGLLKKRTVLTLHIGLDSDNLRNSNDGLDLFKQINQSIVKDKDHLERLSYYSGKINKNCTSKQQIEQLIDEVANM